MAQSLFWFVVSVMVEKAQKQKVLSLAVAGQTLRVPWPRKQRAQD